LVVGGNALRKMSTANIEEKRLPSTVLEKAIKSGNEFGWRQEDFIDTIETARKLRIAICGGQVQYVLPDATCELYWLAFDPTERRATESWMEYCDRTATEAIEKFSDLVQRVDFESEAIHSFEVLREKKSNGVNLDDYKTFIIYFDDQGTDL